MIKKFEAEVTKNITVTFKNEVKVKQFFVDNLNGMSLYSFGELEDVAEFLIDEFTTNKGDMYDLKRGVTFRDVEGFGEFIQAYEKGVCIYSNKSDERVIPFFGEIIIASPADFDIYIDED